MAKIDFKKALQETRQGNDTTDVLGIETDNNPLKEKSIAKNEGKKEIKEPEKEEIDIFQDNVINDSPTKEMYVYKKLVIEKIHYNDETKEYTPEYTNKSLKEFLEFKEKNPNKNVIPPYITQKELRDLYIKNNLDAYKYIDTKDFLNIVRGVASQLNISMKDFIHDAIKHELDNYKEETEKAKTFYGIGE